MLEEYRGRLRAVKVRFAAMFSDYCEYPPLYKFLETWLSPVWNQRILGGRGRSAIPYLHVRDATRACRKPMPIRAGNWFAAIPMHKAKASTSSN